jgi:hypothetical protein
MLGQESVWRGSKGERGRGGGGGGRGGRCLERNSRVQLWNLGAALGVQIQLSPSSIQVELPGTLVQQPAQQLQLQAGFLPRRIEQEDPPTRNRLRFQPGQRIDEYECSKPSMMWCNHILTQMPASFLVLALPSSCSKVCYVGMRIT